ncbi:spermatogenesis-defective protein 39 homolog [Phymastichus coffea]|uniref:spermatogenesis-defective protein 39 homolog n=1 Tax=Phymastichus coffea TaxID=108790 RepID=UPI00273B79A2|nr:spermatogenesis-defective protein 39 homolog [Phymastichus coffea]
MAMSYDDEEFWNSSEKRAFSFESNETDNLFGVSKIGTAELRAGISNIHITDSSLRYDEPESTTKPLLSIISDNTLAKIIEADKLKFQQDNSGNIKPEDTLKKILVGQPYSFEQYKSLASKTALLDAAIKSGNGNAILGITLFIKKTLKRNLVQKLLIDRPEALYTYIHYLSIRMCTSEICDLLTAKGSTTDAAIKCFNVVVKNINKSEGNLDSLLSKITKNYNMLFSNFPDCREAAFVQSYVKLLEWQKNSSNKFSEPIPFNASTLESLRLSCKDYWNAPETNSLSPQSLVQNQDILQRQYQKVAVLTRASVQAWDDIDSILHKKSFFGGKKLQTNMPIEEVLKLLQDHRAPSGVIEQFLSYVDGTKRLEIAKNLKCHKVVINILAAQGDRFKLLEYKASLPQNLEESSYADGVLNSKKFRWKN